jgi:hypothetical protein
MLTTCQGRRIQEAQRSTTDASTSTELGAYVPCRGDLGEGGERAMGRGREGDEGREGDGSRSCVCVGTVVCHPQPCHASAGFCLDETGPARFRGRKKTTGNSTP